MTLGLHVVATNLEVVIDDEMGGSHKDNLKVPGKFQGKVDFCKFIPFFQTERGGEDRMVLLSLKPAGELAGHCC